MNIGLEGLVGFGFDGRARPWLADKWESSPDGLKRNIRLRSGVTFHDGSPLTSAAVIQFLNSRLEGYIGPAFQDIERFKELSDLELEISLKRPSNFVLEGLDVLVYRGEPDQPVGTGPFSPGNTSHGRVEMVANNAYHDGSPSIDRLVITPYSSVRSAWADLLRNKVDMLYEVGIDAADSLEPSSEVRVFTFPRPYASVVILNIKNPQLRDPAFRRGLNTAINRQAIVDEALSGHGTPSDGPVWPHHWAYDPSLARFEFEPRALDSDGSKPHFRLLYAEPSHERVALTLQRQLRAVGVDVTPETASLDEALARAQKGDFDAFLVDASHGPTMLRPYWFWYSKSPFNWGHFNSPAVDAAFDLIRDAKDDKAYKAGVAAFQRAIVQDPPAIFLAWSERARAVSTRFEVPAEPGRDILPTLRLWRPRTDTKAVNPN